MNNTEAKYRVMVGHGHEVHAAVSNEWPGRTVCGLSWTDEGEDFYRVTCRNCASRLTGKGQPSRVIEQANVGAVR